jgi:cobalt/nickel transport system permease protein
VARIDTALGDIGALDAAAAFDSPVHRLDPRAKLLATAAFLVTVVSFPKHELAELMPLFFFPIAMMSVGRVPAGILGRYLLLASPFAVMVGIFNPLLDRAIVIHWGPLAISGGWLSFASIVIRFLLTAGAALLLLACTGYVRIAAALGWFGMPRLLVTQFLLLYRFIFVLADEAGRMARAHTLRSRSGRGAAVRVWGSLAGHLLLRAHDRGLRLHAAMLARGFDGALRPLRGFHWAGRDSAFVLGCLGFFVLARFGQLAGRLGALTLEMMP